MDALEQTVLSVAKQLEDKVDEEIGKLENLSEKELAEIRKKRLGDLKKQAARRDEWLKAGHGEYTELDEKDFFTSVKASERVVCHFYRENWPCKVVDKHLTSLCRKHVETRFMKIHAEKSPFLTERLRVTVLPTLALIKGGKVDDYVVGFDEFGGKDDFEEKTLEDRLARSGAIFAEEAIVPTAPKPSSISKGLAFQKTASDEDSDFDE